MSTTTVPIRNAPPIADATATAAATLPRCQRVRSAGVSSPVTSGAFALRGLPRSVGRSYRSLTVSTAVQPSGPSTINATADLGHAAGGGTRAPVASTEPKNTPPQPNNQNQGRASRTTAQG